MELRFDRSLPGRGGNDQSRLHSVAAAIPIKGNRQNFMGRSLMIYSLPTPVYRTLVLWVQEPQRRQGNRRNRRRGLYGYMECSCRRGDYYAVSQIAAAS